MFEYDISIRTLGNGGEKYQKLLDSICSLSPQPKEIIVILPEGATPPKERIGCEKFVYAPCGMMTQRISMLQLGTSEFILFCDDDIAFEEDFVQKLYHSISNDGFAIATGEVMAFLPEVTGIKKWIPVLTGAAIPVSSDKWYVRILPTSGWTYHRFKPREGFSISTQSAAGCMFFCSRETFKRLDFAEELWAQHGSLAPADDQIMFYKAYLSGLYPCVVTDAHYDHLSAKSATNSVQKLNEKVKWAGFNRYVFWHRFIYMQYIGFFRKSIACLGILYFFLMQIVIYGCVRCVYKPYSFIQTWLMIKGFIMGINYTFSEKYKKMKPIN